MANIISEAVLNFMHACINPWLSVHMTTKSIASQFLSDYGEIDIEACCWNLCFSYD